MKVLITGATGFIGTKLTHKLLEGGHSVVVLSRNAQKAKEHFQGKVEAYTWNSGLELPPVEAFQGVDGVINLAGESIAEKRWCKTQKKKIYDSRILTTRHLVQQILNLSQKPSVLISTSAIGVYGNRDDEFLAESSTSGGGFLANVCDYWEREVTSKAKDLPRSVIIRVGIVLGKEGGALSKLLPIFKLGAGGPIGNGKQWMSWIHVDDLVNLYVHALTQSSVVGVINGVAPYPVTNQEFTKTLGRAVKRPALFMVPPCAMKVVMGEMSCIVLDSQKIGSEKIKSIGFEFQYKDLKKALVNLV